MAIWGMTDSKWAGELSVFVKFLTSAWYWGITITYIMLNQNKALVGKFSFSSTVPTLFSIMYAYVREGK